MDDFEKEIKKMQCEYDMGAWKGQILQNTIAIKKAETEIVKKKQANRDLENKILEKMGEIESLG